MQLRRAGQQRPTRTLTTALTKKSYDNADFWNFLKNLSKKLLKTNEKLMKALRNAKIGTKIFRKILGILKFRTNHKVTTKLGKTLEQLRNILKRSSEVLKIGSQPTAICTTASTDNYFNWKNAVGGGSTTLACWPWPITFIFSPRRAMVITTHILMQKINIRGQVVQKLQWKQTYGRTRPISIPEPLTPSVISHQSKAGLVKT